MSRRTPRSLMRRIGGALTALAASASLAAAAVPGQVSFQGLLLDAGGQPVTGTADLDFSIFPVASGGTALWSESHADVDVQDGVYSVSLGSLTAISPSVLEGGTVFLEIRVDGETLAPRQQLLAVPYAIRSATSQTTEAVGTVSSSFVTELWEHTNFDGGPPNDDPDEGLADVDGDTIANFIDSDNDGDGRNDGLEVSQGSGINLITPTITGFNQNTADAGVTTTVTIEGTNFEPGMTVAFGSETPTPMNVTATSTNVDVGPQAPGPATVTVTRVNGESASNSSFQFLGIIPTLTGFDPPYAPDDVQTLVTLEGTDFDPAMTVSFGSETPTPTNVTPTSADVLVGPQSGTVNVTVTLPGGGSAMSTYGFFGVLPGQAHSVDSDGQQTFTGQLSFGVKGAMQTLLGMKDEYGADSDADLVPETLLPFVSDAVQGQLAVGWDASGAGAGVRCRETGSQSCDVEFARDSDSDLALGDETGIVIETLSGQFGVHIEAPSLAFDSSNAPAVGYLKVVPGSDLAAVAHDRNADGDFDDLLERVDIEVASGFTPGKGELAVDPSGRVAYVYGRDATTVRVAYDRNGDGAFDDLVGGNPELFTLATGAFLNCLGASFDSSGGLAIVFQAGSGPVQLARDLDQDGAIAGQEITAVTTGSADVCDVSGHPGTGLAVAHNEAGRLTLLFDRNDDDDFEEVIVLESEVGGTANAIELRRNASGEVAAGSNDKVWLTSP